MIGICEGAGCACTLTYTPLLREGSFFSARNDSFPIPLVRFHGKSEVEISALGMPLYMLPRLLLSASTTTSEIGAHTCFLRYFAYNFFRIFTFYPQELKQGR